MSRRKRRNWNKRYHRAKKKANTRAKYGPRMRPAPVKITKADGSEAIVDQSQLKKETRPKKGKRYSAILERKARDAGYETYEHFLRSPLWREQRREALIRDSWRCRRCESKLSLQVHHKRYAKVLGTEKLEDLETLCNTCHRKHHNH